MSTWVLVLLIVVLVLIVLGIGGAVAVSTRSRARAGALHAEVERANELLAEARAADRGWDLALIVAAAREGLISKAERYATYKFHLVEVVDRPGTDEDRAIVRAIDDGDEVDIELKRTGDLWSAVEIP